MTQPRVLIACVGNIFRGDDAFGVEVARRLATRPLPPDVVLRDFGIRAFDLAFALLDGYEKVILVDACPRGGAPGTVYLMAPEQVEMGLPADIETHGLDPQRVFRMVKSMGGSTEGVLIVGCEPAELGPEDEGKMGLSEPVQAAVNEAIGMIEMVLAKTMRRGAASAGS